MSPTTWADCRRVRAGAPRPAGRGVLEPRAATGRTATTSRHPAVSDERSRSSPPPPQPSTSARARAAAAGRPPTRAKKPGKRRQVRDPPVTRRLMVSRIAGKAAQWRPPASQSVGFPPHHRHRTNARGHRLPKQSLQTLRCCPRPAGPCYGSALAGKLSTGIDGTSPMTLFRTAILGSWSSARC